MPDPIRPRPAEGSTWSRRSLLALGLASGTAAWTGCTVSDPAIRGRRATPPVTTSSATPTPRPSGAGTAAEAATELQLAAGAAALRRRPSQDAARDQALLELVQQTHLERAAALSGPDPAARPTAGGESTATASPARPSRAALADEERRAARRYRTTALASSGLPALLWGSMSVASTRFAAALDADASPPAGPLREHRPMPQLSDTEAVAALVSGLHATIYGYQLALGRLGVTSSAHARATAGLADRRALLHRLSGRLVQAGVDVPPAAPAYDPSPEVRDAATAVRLVRRMESALLPFCGLWLAAAGRPADRRQALDTLAATAARAASWSAPLTAWPGWQD